VEQFEIVLEWTPKVLANNPVLTWIVKESIACIYNQFGLLEKSAELELGLMNIEPSHDDANNGLLKLYNAAVGYRSIAFRMLI
jgi:hypothetical protein